MVKVDKIAGGTTAAVFVALLLALLFVNQPSAASFQIDDNVAKSFTLESAYATDEVRGSEHGSPDYDDHPDFLKSAVYQLPESQSQSTMFKLILTISDVDAFFSNIRAPPVLS